MMLGKQGGRGRVARVLAKSGYGKSAGGKIASGSGSEHHDGISSALKTVDRELHASGGASKMRLDRKSRASGGALTSKKRNALPTSSFAEAGKRKYPINDSNHARNALARVSHFGSPSEKSKVRSAVHRKYPSMGQKKK